MKILFPAPRMTPEEIEEEVSRRRRAQLAQEALIGVPHESGECPWYLVRVEVNGQQRKG
jgi:hypothetical protein